MKVTIAPMFQNKKLFYYTVTQRVYAYEDSGGTGGMKDIGTTVVNRRCPKIDLPLISRQGTTAPGKKVLL